MICRTERRAEEKQARHVETATWISVRTCRAIILVHTIISRNHDVLKAESTSSTQNVRSGPGGWAARGEPSVRVSVKGGKAVSSGSRSVNNHINQSLQEDRRYREDENQEMDELSVEEKGPG